MLLEYSLERRRDQRPKDRAGHHSQLGHHNGLRICFRWSAQSTLLRVAKGRRTSSVSLVLSAVSFLALHEAAISYCSRFNPPAMPSRSTNDYISIRFSARLGASVCAALVSCP